MTQTFASHIAQTLQQIDADGLRKKEREITTPQSGQIRVGSRDIINLCANNYLGLADHPALINAAANAMQTHGFGMASVRFICGTQDLHRQLEKRMAALTTPPLLMASACARRNAFVTPTLI